MAASISKRNNWVAVRDEVLELATKMYLHYFRRRMERYRLLRRKLINWLRSIVQNDPSNNEAWVLLGDTLTPFGMRVHCYRSALKADPRDAEAHGELARLYARQSDKRFATHFDRALRFCKKSLVEDDILSALVEAATAAKDQRRLQLAVQTGRRRFPKSTMFRRVG